MSGGDEHETAESERTRAHDKEGERPNKWRQYIITSVVNPHNLPHFLNAAFTLALACFAYEAWTEARRGTAALEGQLIELKEEQRPMIWTNPNTTSLQGFDEKRGRVMWDWNFLNQGKSPAYHLSTHGYIRVGNERFEPDQNTIAAVEGPFIPPNEPERVTIISRSGFSRDYYNGLLGVDGGLALLIENTYWDASHKQSWSESLCVERLASGAMLYLDPDDCKKQK